MKKADWAKVQRAKNALDKAVKLLEEVDDSLKAEISPNLSHLYERRTILNAHGNAEQSADYLDILLNPNPPIKEL